MLTQKLPNEVVDNDLVGTSLDTIIFKINVPSNWTRTFRFSARYAGYNKAFVETIGEEALYIDSSGAAISKYIFTTTGNHNIRFTAGTHYVKINMMSGFNLIDLSTMYLPMYLVFGTPKYIYRTCSSGSGIGNIIVNNLPYDSTKYLISDKSSSPGSVADFRMYCCKCDDIAKVVNRINTGDETVARWHFGNSMDIHGDIACMDGRNGLHFYSSNTKITGDIKYLGNMVSLNGSTTGDPAINITNSGIYGDFEEFAQALFDNGKHSETIMCIMSNTQVTYNGEIINGNATISFTEEDFTITLV